MKIRDIPLSPHIFEDLFAALSLRSIRLLSFILTMLFALMFFGKYLLHPTAYSFASVGDDLKNYFTLKTYLDQPTSVAFSHYTYMNFPFGETIYFTDNSPIIALVLKVIKTVFGLDSNTLVFVFDLLIIANLLLAGQLIISIFRRFVSSHLLLVGLSITLPFTNPQAIRLFIGTENLGLSSVLLFALLQSIRIYEATTVSKKKVLIESFWMTLVIIICSFIHLYYLLLMLFFVGPFLFIMGIRQFLKEKKADLFVAAFLIVSISFIVVQGIITVTDPYLNFRKDGANGFGWEPWKLSIPSLFTPYDWFYSGFFVACTRSINYESLCYLGPLVLYGFLLMLALKYVFNMHNTQRNMIRENPMVFWIWSTSLISLFVSLGYEYAFFDNEYVFKNYLNVSLYMSYFTNKFTHFRCLGRFSWLFFWSMNLVAALWLDRMLEIRKWIVSFCIYALIYLSVQDALHMGYQYRYAIVDNRFSEKNYSAVTKYIKTKVHNSEYDAILFLPFFQTGSEDYPNTIDPSNESQKISFELSNALQLPMMSFMMSRTPQNFNKAQLNFYRTGTLDPLERPKMLGKTILIVKNESLYDAVLTVGNNCSDTTLNTFKQSKQLPMRLGLQPFDSIGTFLLYKWKVPAN